MTSKEALKQIKNHLLAILELEAPELTHHCENKFNIIEKDLDRLEKLKKAIEILKDKFELELINEELHFNTYECNTREIHELYDEWFYNLTKDEYELLKEVLENA